MKLPSITAAALCLAVPAAFTQESKEELVKRLRGSAGQESESTGQPATGTSGLTTRGFTTRSLVPNTPVAPKKETRSLLLSTRGIPKAVQVAAEEDKVSLTKTTATESSSAGDNAVSAGEDAIELNYDVDPTSKVARDNILFRKGSAEFADEASFRVVAELADALKDSSLAQLKFVIEGHASAEGSAVANQSLSQQRAERIVSVLGSLGVSEDRLLPVGFGETQARFPAHSEEFLLKQDRRVLIFRLEN